MMNMCFKTNNGALVLLHSIHCSCCVNHRVTRRLAKRPRGNLRNSYKRLGQLNIWNSWISRSLREPRKR